MLTIIMTTYNSKDFAKVQIDSLLTQTLQDFHLVISDDKSTDGTIALLEEYQAAYPEKITLLQNEVNSGDPKLHFMRLMIAHKDDYVMLCDQDDFWLPEKVEQSLLAIRQLEAEVGKNNPCLVHTDLQVVDEHLGRIAPSFAAYIGLSPLKNLKAALMQNDVTGCTAIYNRALADYLTGMPPDFVMHDWWIALIAQAFGHKKMLTIAPILYRQHGKNAVGAQKVKGLAYKIKKLSQGKKVRAAWFASCRQAGAFAGLYGDKMTEDDREMLMTFAALPGQNKIRRILTMKKHGFFRKGFARKLSQIFFT